MYKLRELEKKDIATINKWRNTRELIDYLGAPYRYINLDVEDRWYESYLNNRNNTIRCSIYMEDKKHEILGLVSLTNINRINQSAVFHIMIGEQSNRQKGLGYFATMEILRHAFEDINLQRIELTVLESNIRAIKLYEKVGFKREGIKRKAVYKNGEFLDMIIMSILKDEYINV